VVKKSSNKSNSSNIRTRIKSSIKNFFVKATGPIRDSKVWKFLRRTILRSPFKGYFINAFKELKYVEWPNRRKAWSLTITVILFSTLFAMLTTGLDYGFEKIAKQLFLK
jgi:preprotein translocase SecE subunit